VDYTSCQCIPAGGTTSGGPGGVGCDFTILLFLILLCPDGIDFAACDCAAPGTSSSSSGGGTSSGGAGGCTDTCQYPGDGECDDGGQGSLTSLCALGTDCTDCGPRGGGGTSSSGGTSSGGTSSGGPANVGSACTLDNQCSAPTGRGTPFCVTEDAGAWIGGYCSAPCDTNADCGAGGVCVNLGNNAQGQPIVVCLEDCQVASPTSCRPQYFCTAFTDGSGNGACWPKCTGNADCNTGYTCNLTTGECE